MRYVKYGIIVIFIAVTVMFALSWYRDKMTADVTPPEIQVSTEQLEVSVNARIEDMLQGVVARDDRDGDLSDQIVIESISKFIDKKEHVCNITYVVADSNNNIAKKTRKLKYTDYVSPRFDLAQQLCFNVGSEIDLSGIILATDVIDGDISNKVKILSSSISAYTAGEYTIMAQVTNSLGDTVKIKTMALVKAGNNLSPEIKLKKNIVYLKKGDSFSENKYIDKVNDHNGKKISNKKVSVTASSVNTDKVGAYNVEYMVKDDENNEGKAYLTVVVEE